MIEPMIAPVRPRVIVGGARGIVLLEDLVPEVAASGLVKAIELLGPQGFGTTTALRHLAAIFGTDGGLVFVDAKPSSGFVQRKVTGAIVFPKASLKANPVVLQFKLAGWGRDEWIEYLLSVHKDQCSSVMKRVLDDKEMESLEGSPNILRMVLDEFAADDRLQNVKSAVQQAVDRLFPTEDVLADIRDVVRSLNLLMYKLDTLDVRNVFVAELSAANKKLTDDQIRLFCTRVIQLHFLTDVAWHDLLNQAPTQFFHNRWSRRLISLVAARLVEAPTIQNILQEWIASDERALQPMAVSLLHASGAEWQLPDVIAAGVQAKQNNLNGAFLDKAKITGKRLVGCSMQRASFQNANLSNVDLTDADGKEANFNLADLRNTTLTRFGGLSARFVGANLSDACGQHAQLGGSNLSGANMVDTQFENSNFANANLSHCNFQDARLTSCDFRGANLREADFSGCDLMDSKFDDLDLTEANFLDARFRAAQMKNCNLECMELPEADFSSAWLENAELTGTVMPRADFCGAILRCAKLSEIDWEGADLQHADLTGATFHMGSSRSGLVDSSIPMEGSRTGFYTDELNEQDFKAPEEIRKANLRGADLRNAIIDGVDFYLVDLRDAYYDPDQVEQLRRTGAILESREC